MLKRAGDNTGPFGLPHTGQKQRLKSTGKPGDAYLTTLLESSRLEGFRTKLWRYFRRSLQGFDKDLDDFKCYNTQPSLFVPFGIKWVRFLDQFLV